MSLHKAAHTICNSASPHHEMRVSMLSSAEVIQSNPQGVQACGTLKAFMKSLSGRSSASCICPDSSSALIAGALL